ncbi:MAG: methionine biosynthesis protein MetW [Actinobacteria bacterium]|jgi:methionine biosynthesis protein MetW|nr:methionine biosynthesis protein MetW [Actinomycetota bacterium]
MARIDYQLIRDLVPEGATVLDLGCGDGELLAELIEEKQVRGSGVDISPSAVEACVARGLSVFHGDLDGGLADFDDGSFDVVILSFSLQQLYRPRLVLREMARVGKLALVSFPNFAHWWARAQLFALGRMPISRELPYEWYDTPNIHLCTIRDFRRLCVHEGLRVEQELYLHSFERPAPRLRCPNLTARIALFAVTRGVPVSTAPV